MLNQALPEILKAPVFSGPDFFCDVRLKIFLWIVRDCAEFKNTNILHVSFIELSLSIIRGYCRRLSFYWMVLPLVERRKILRLKLKTYWIVQHFAGRRHRPIPFFAQTAIADCIPDTLQSPMIFWRLPASFPRFCTHESQYAPTVKSRDFETKGLVPLLGQSQVAHAREGFKNRLRRIVFYCVWLSN